ncbi:MAG: ATP-binding protein [Roseobacter sp.]|nr:ATP-binding protein [Roseobacter sp.]
MRHSILTRLGLWGAFLALVLAASFGVYRYGLGQAMAQLKARGQADLALAGDRFATRLQRYQELAVMMADHPNLGALTGQGAGEAGRRAAAEDFLRSAADKTGALALAYVSRKGAVLAQAGEALGAEALDGPWRARAAQGALGTGHGSVQSQTGARRAYFYAAPDFGPDGRVRAMLLVVVDIDELEYGWRSSSPAVYFTTAQDQVFMANRSELVFARVRAEDAGLVLLDGAEARSVQRLEGGEEIWELALGPYIPRRALHLTKEMPVMAMRAEALVDVAPAERLAGLQALVVAAVLVAFGAILFLVTERRRALVSANRQLEARVEARTGELRRAQAELVQTGKLSALGQMSAGISHELNQPLMAIGQFAENGVRFLAQGKSDIAGENLRRISALSTRAARIIKNLRAFARNESEPMGRIELGAVISAAVELTQTRLTEAGVAMDWRAPEAPLYVKAGEVRLGQVFVNLITNAADAMQGQAGEKTIHISCHAGARLIVEVRDTGPGISDPEKIFEPFYSTKAVGSAEGMGLGLSISYGLIESFGGKITGRNATLAEGARGAVFTVALERWSEDTQP